MLPVNSWVKSLRSKNVDGAQLGAEIQRQSRLTLAKEAPIYGQLMAYEIGATFTFYNKFNDL